MNAIDIKGIDKRYQEFHLENISLSLPQGSIMGLVGENGAGKSTLIKLIMNAVEADSGTVEVLGISNKSDSFTAVKEDIGIVLDEAYYPEVLTVKRLGIVMKNTYKNWSDAKYQQYLSQLSLPDNKEFREFSRGMKMKLAIAVALSHDPKLLILDEATSGLDPMVRDEILDMFNEFTREENHSILLSSHIVSDLEKICDYIAFLHHGQLYFCDEKDRLREEYAIVKLSKEAFDDLPEAAVKGVKRMEYNVEALVHRPELRRGIPAERTSLEDIILCMAKGDRR